MFFPIISYRRFLLDYMLMIIPMVLVLTVLSDFTVSMLMLVLSCVVTLLFFVDRRSHDSPHPTRMDDLLNTAMINKRPYITYFRLVWC